MTSKPSETPRSVRLTGLPPRRLTFTKSNRILRTADYRRVYDEGTRVPSTCFAAFCWRAAEPDGPRIGFTTPRALGKSTARNRMKRRLRDCVRRSLWRIDPHWHIVFNLRRAALGAPFPQIETEVDKLVQRCSI